MIDYYDEKQEYKELLDKFDQVLSMLEYSHITGEWAYDYKKVSEFIGDIYEWRKGRNNNDL